MYDGNILGTQHLVDSLLLGWVQVGEVHRLEGIGFCFLLAVKQVAQITQSSLATDGTVQCFHHQTVAGLVERQLYSQVLCILQVYDVGIVCYRHHHAVAVYKAYHPRKLEIGKMAFTNVTSFTSQTSLTSLTSKEHHWPSELEVMFNVCVCRSAHLHSQLVQRVIIALHET